jgi:putative serine protease PepD
VSTVLATALLAGAAGGWVGARGDRTVGVHDATATLGTPVTSTPVSRPSTSVAGIAARVLRSVVSIQVDSGTTGGTGSGVVLRSDGYVLTNNHVVAGGGSITVSFTDESQTDLKARVVGTDPETDLAVIKILGSPKLVPATLGTSSDLVVGDPVLAIGSPLGLAGTVTSGIISALNRTVQVPSETGAAAPPLFNAIQTDAAINPGNSGGPLLNSAGQVIGFNDQIDTNSTNATGQGSSAGVGFAVPSNTISRVARDIIATGKAQNAYVGVSLQPSSTGGAGVGAVVASGPGAAGGLKAGDKITAVDGHTVSTVNQFIATIANYSPGDTVTLTVQRSGSNRSVQVKLGTQPASSAAAGGTGSVP